MIGNKVNGQTICASNNTNNNDLPGCDMSSDPGYSDNGTPNDLEDDTYSGDLIVRTNDLIEMKVKWNATGVNNPITLTSTLPSFAGKNYLAWESLPSICKDGSSISGDGLIFHPKSQDNLKKNLIPFKIFHFTLQSQLILHNYHC